MSDIAQVADAGVTARTGAKAAVPGGHGAPAAERGRTNKSVGFSSRPYWLYLIPGGLLFVVVILGPLVYNVYLSLTKWSGRRAAEVHRPRQLPQAAGRTASSGSRSRTPSR